MADRDDWQVGDLALCVKVGTWDRHGWNAEISGLPTSGGVYTVTEMRAVASGDVGLGFDEFVTVFSRTRVIFNPTRFRKIKPLSDEEQMLGRAEFKADRIINAPVSA